MTKTTPKKNFLKKSSSKKAVKKTTPKKKSVKKSSAKKNFLKKSSAKRVVRKTTPKKKSVKKSSAKKKVVRKTTPSKKVVKKTTPKKKSVKKSSSKKAVKKTSKKKVSRKSMKGGFMNLNNKNNSDIKNLLNNYEAKANIMKKENNLFFIDYTENDLNNIYNNLINILSNTTVQERLKGNKELAKVFLEDMIQSFYYKIQYLQNINRGYISTMKNSIINMFDNLFQEAFNIFGKGVIIERLNYIYNHLGIITLIAESKGQQQQSLGNQVQNMQGQPYPDPSFLFRSNYLGNRFAKNELRRREKQAAKNNIEKRRNNIGSTPENRSFIRSMFNENKVQSNPNQAAEERQRQQEEPRKSTEETGLTPIEKRNKKKSKETEQSFAKDHEKRKIINESAEIRKKILETAKTNPKKAKKKFKNAIEKGQLTRKNQNGLVAEDGIFN
jgi:hypothetical protein